MARAILMGLSALSASWIAVIAVFSLLPLDTNGGLSFGFSSVRIDAGFAAFTISLLPVLALVSALSFLWELIGRRPSVLAFGVAWPATAYFGLVAFFYIVYGYGPAFPLAGDELRLLLSFTVGGIVFAVARRASAEG